MRVTGSDFNTIPAPDPDDPDITPSLRIVPCDEFIDTHEETAEPLLGTETETVLPADGTLLMYGDGGAGKTTLTVDAITHLASGVNWLNITTPRASRITIIENEGPRAKFRQLLREKRAAWNGHPAFTPNTQVLEEPWTQFTLKDDQHRLQLAQHITLADIDIVVMGPVVTLGVIGGGTPEEIAAFETLIRDLRRLTARPFALWLLHHENKAGDVSGAWERVPDTMLHITAQGNGHTKLYWRKVRWSSATHGTTLNLIWGDGRTYIVDEPRERDLHTEILESYAEHGDQWRTAKEQADLIGANVDHVRDTLTQLVERGELDFQQGPPGRRHNARCWRINRPTETSHGQTQISPETDIVQGVTIGDSDPPSQSESPAPVEGAESSTDSLTRPSKEESVSESAEPAPPTDSDPQVSSTQLGAYDDPDF